MIKRHKNFFFCILQPTASLLMTEFYCTRIPTSCNNIQQRKEITLETLVVWILIFIWRHSTFIKKKILKRGLEKAHFVREWRCHTQLLGSWISAVSKYEFSSLSPLELLQSYYIDSELVSLLIDICERCLELSTQLYIWPLDPAKRQQMDDWNTILSPFK